MICHSEHRVHREVLRVAYSLVCHPVSLIHHSIELGLKIPVSLLLLVALGLSRFFFLLLKGLDQVNDSLLELFLTSGDQEVVQPELVFAPYCLLDLRPVSVSELVSDLDQVVFCFPAEEF